MVKEYLEKRSISLEPLPEFYKYCDNEFDENSVYHLIVPVLEKYLIQHKDKTILDILYQLNYRQVELMECLYKIDKEVSAKFITDTIVYSDLAIAKDHIKKLTYWLFKDDIMSDDFKAEFEILTKYRPAI